MLAVLIKSISWTLARLAGNRSLKASNLLRRYPPVPTFVSEAIQHPEPRNANGDKQQYPGVGQVVIPRLCKQQGRWPSHGRNFASTMVVRGHEKVLLQPGKP